ncbi:MAG: glycosyltransferase [Solirubrobacterales bacterium]|nr:glycosyltransferase [Solirubrobacterales bacterium]MBV9919058.1 glycosyltransferase [Solirubrobacterales bacterium]
MAASTAAGGRLALEVFEPPDGGVPEHALLLALGLRDRGFEVELVGPRDSQVEARASEAGIRLHTLAFRRDYRHPWDDARAGLELRRLVQARRPGIVHCHASKAGAIGRAALAGTGTRTIYTPHCFGFVGEVSRARQLLVSRTERALARLSAKIVCVCEAELAVARGNRIGTPEQLAVLRYGVPEADHQSLADPRLSELRQGGRLFANIARLRTQKRQDVFLEAARVALDRDERARIALIGNGPLAPELRAQAARLGLDRDARFALLPFTPPVERYMSAIDVFVLSSSWEALPISLLEAQAWGVPQIATAVFGTPEIITPQTGRLVAPRDPADLAAAMLELNGDEVDFEAMSEASRARHAERFTLERMLSETASLYEEVLSSPT